MFANLKIAPTHYKNFDKIILTDENEYVRATYYTDKATGYIINHCPMLKFYRLSQNKKILEVMVSLLNKYPNDYLNCNSMKRELSKLQFLIPIEYSCNCCKYHKQTINTNEEKKIEQIETTVQT